MIEVSLTRPAAPGVTHKAVSHTTGEECSKHGSKHGEEVPRSGHTRGMLHTWLRQDCSLSR